MPQLKPRNTGHNKIHSILRDEWTKAIHADPEVFDVLLFRTKADASQGLDDTVGGVPMFGMLQDDNIVLDYDPPVKQMAVELPNEEYQTTLTDDGDDMPAEVIKLKLDTHEVPDRSVIQFLTENDDGGHDLTSWYIMRSEVIGQAQIGVIYHLIPFDGEDTALPVA